MSWDQQQLVNAFNIVTLTPPPAPAEWYFDSGAGSHMATDSSILTSSSSFNPPNIVVGNGSLLPITSTGSLRFPLSVMGLFSPLPLPAHFVSLRPWSSRSK